MFRHAVVLLLVLAAPSLALAQVGPSQERYVVVLKEGPGLPENVAAGLARATGGRIGYIYNSVIRGFSITVPASARTRLARDPRVAYVEEDIPISIFAQTVPTGVNRVFADKTVLGINGVDDYRVDVDVAVLDTGIDVQHPDLNVVGGANCLYSTGGSPFTRTSYCKAESGDDDHYHGTHVAGTIGALDNGIGVVGVAPGARLWAVKVLDSQGSGSLSGIIAGIDWVAATGGIKVINMSLGGSGTSQAMNDAVSRAVQSGVTVVVAAGNSDADAAKYTPANAPDAITVSALADFNGLAGGGAAATCRSDQDDTLADFSNWGATTINIAAPGVCILSTYPIERGEYGTISGTSMASPHVAGAAALLASTGKTPSQIRAMLLDPASGGAPLGGNFNWTDDSGDGVKEPLLDISNPVFTPTLVAVAEGGDEPVLSASFNWSSADLTVNFKDSSTGSIVRHSWNFGDDQTSSDQHPTHTYAWNGTGEFRVTLTVFDDKNASETSSKLVTVSQPSTSSVTLNAKGYKVKGNQTVDLSWIGTGVASVNLFRNGIQLVVSTSSGDYTDSIGQKGSGSYDYYACEGELGTSTCSNAVNVTF
jgi:subtilisin